MNHIYLIEDDVKLAKLIQMFLLKHGYTLDVFNSVTAYQDHQATFIPSLIICDVMLPDGNGFELFKQLQNEHTCPIIFLTALDSNQSQIKGLNLGACDYLVKPIMPNLLLAKVNAILRQSTINNQHISEYKQLTLDHQNKTISFAKLDLNLNENEYEIVAFLVKNAPHPVSREVLFQHVIGREYDGLDRAIDLKVSRLRKKLTALFNASYELNCRLDIKSVRGKGYCLDIQTASDQ
ncbi:response regulator transcription factor [Pseudoalteromonas sp. MMG010]|uniref:response regulator transcription factor n=1 Tax=Pseudoalteromonas sp. MMG010 TaxID=2822685 RepID=UPI001B39E9E4|nr:response regulator transcription factor [Pseudoalteromonas sp. MMG010]MBQ4832150.1 response regulator transcription factor [Pseudoalteromonas sp. MMG010]